MERNNNGLKIFSKTLQYVATESPAIPKISTAMKVGCVAVPTTRSVAAKQANSMLYMLSSLGLVLTAIITNTFVRTITGQLNMLRIMEARVERTFAMKYSSSWNRRQYSPGSWAVELVRLTADLLLNMILRLS